jgi:hypothetical protein
MSAIAFCCSLLKIDEQLYEEHQDLLFSRKSFFDCKLNNIL